MNIRLQLPKVTELKPRITVVGVGGAGGNAIENMINSGLEGVEFVVANTDAQALSLSSAANVLQLGATLTEGLGAGSKPEIGQAAAEEAIAEIEAQFAGAHMVFIAAGMGGGTGTGAAAVIARAARDLGILTIAIVTKPFLFEGTRRMRVAEAGIAALKPNVDTLIVIPNQNLFRIADEKTTFSEAFLLADQVLHSGISCIVDLIIREGLINLDFADVKTVMQGMGDAVMGTGEASGDRRAERAAELAIANPLLDNITLAGAKGLLVSIVGDRNLTLYEVDEAANRVKREVDPDANIIIGANVDETLADRLRVSIVASGMDRRSAGYPRSEPDSGTKWMPADRAERPSASTAIPMPPPLPEWPDPDTTTGRAEEQDDSNDIAAALSEAFSQANGPEWQSTKGVRIEEGLPQLSAAAEPRRGHLDGPPAQGLSRGAAEFTPQLTEAPRRPVPRMPEVEDFPPIGQREYYAKREPNQQPHSERRDQMLARQIDEARHPSDSRRPSLFERLTGVRRRATDKPKHESMPGPAAPPKSPNRAAPPDSGEAVRPQWTQARRDEPRDTDDDTDLPGFFNGRGRR